MKQLECMYAYDCDSDRIEFGPWPDKPGGWSDRYEMTMGACETDIRKMSELGRHKRLFIDFNTIVVRDGVPVEAAHRAFLRIDEYRRLISPDAPGAEVE
nr:hypothetical protein [uncultured Lichenicoccus sp.]